MKAKKDIESYDDCLQLISWFYEKLLKDELISHYFKPLNLESHIPKVADFWAFVLIDKPGYSNNMINAHARLALQEKDFDRWLLLFRETIKEHFDGEKVNLAIERSQLIAWTMRSKL
jgi:hemoglobin